MLSCNFLLSWLCFDRLLHFFCFFPFVSVWSVGYVLVWFSGLWGFWLVGVVADLFVCWVFFFFLLVINSSEL